MPGIGLVMDGAMQQAPQPGRHATAGAGGAASGVDAMGEAGCMARLSSRVARRRQPA
jgi:hypothetical protein